MASVASKRKRDPQDVPGLRGPPAMHGESHDFGQGYMTADVEGLDHPDNGIDFSAMLQGNDGEVVTDQQQHNHLVDAGDHNTHTLQSQIQHPEQTNNDTAAAAMAQYHHTMTVPQTTEQAFMRSVPEESGNDSNIDTTQTNVQQTPTFPEYEPDANKENAQEQNADESPSAGGRGRSSGGKPAVNSEEWHKQRKDNHKEVERRRRETINEGINELSKIVPGCEKNKGQILSRAVSFITQLKENETQNIEKWTLEKLLAEQAIAELSATMDRMKHDLQRAQAESQAWKQAAQAAGISMPDSLASNENLTG